MGRSRAGEGTCFGIPELKWMFDCGALVNGWKPTNIFVSHTHSDHVHFLTEFRDDKNPAKVWLPSSAAPLVQAHLDAYQAMIDCGTEGDKLGRLSLRPTQPGEQVVLKKGGTEYICEAIECQHRVVCLGYNFLIRRKKLLDVYKDFPGAEIGRLRKSGVEVMSVCEEPFLCYLGDTTAKVFERYPRLLKDQKLVIVECSFIDDADVERAETTKHMHWTSLRPHIEDNPETLFVLIHFSLKYSNLELRNFFLDNSKHENIHPMLIEEEVEYEWKKSGAESPVPSCNCFQCRPLKEL